VPTYSAIVSLGGNCEVAHQLRRRFGGERAFPFDWWITPLDVSDITVAPALLAQARGARYVLADKGYDADALRQAGAVPVIPGRVTRKRKVVYDKTRYRERHRVENAFCRIKDFRRVATRYDKLAANFLSAVVLASIVAFRL